MRKCVFINIPLLELLESIQDQDIVLLIGSTGTGKSTLVHYFCGATMEETVIDGMPHIRPVNSNSYIGLEQFVTSHIPKSETKSIQAIEIRFYIFELQY